MKESTREEILKDRRAYRQTLIERREGIERKLRAVEEEIGKLKG